jgi:RND family efflux transporter MFP subunit
MNAKRSRTLVVISLVVRAVAVVVILGIGAGLFSALKSMKVEPERNETVATGVPVRAITTSAISVPRVWEGYGSARAMNASTVSAQILARVVSRPEEIEAGLSVKKGALIVSLDSADMISNVQAAESSIASIVAQLESVEAQDKRLREQIVFAEEEREIEERNFERVRNAVNEGAGTEADIDSAIAAVRRSERTLATLQQLLDVLPARRDEINATKAAAVAQLALAQENLDRTTIASPMSGTLQDVFVEEGELLGVGQQVARVVDMTKLEIPLRMPISAASTVRVGDAVELRADGPTQSKWEGRVSRIAPEADAASRTMTVFVEVNQDPSVTGLGEALLMPGQFVLGSVMTSDESPHVLVPRRSVSGDRVMVAAADVNGKASRAQPVDVRVSHYIRGRFPQIDPDETEWAVIELGLEVGELVIISNLDVLVGGMMVEPTDVVRAAAAKEKDNGGGS